VQPALGSDRDERQQRDDPHRGGGAHAPVDVAGLVLRQHQREAEGRRRGQRERDAGADLPPLRRRAEPGRGAEHVERQREPAQHHRHCQQRAAVRAMPVAEPRPQRGPERVGVEGEQRQRHRQARDGRIQAHALHADRTPIAGSATRCRGRNRSGTRAASSSAMTTSAVTLLRIATALTTSSP